MEKQGQKRTEGNVERAKLIAVQKKKSAVNQIEPFKLKAPDAKPSKIEVEFKFEDRYYAYGVEFTIQGIQEEWLFEINERTEKRCSPANRTRQRFLILEH